MLEDIRTLVFRHDDNQDMICRLKWFKVFREANDDSDAYDGLLHSLNALRGILEDQLDYGVVYLKEVGFPPYIYHPSNKAKLKVCDSSMDYKIYDNVNIKSRSGLSIFSKDK